MTNDTVQLPSRRETRRQTRRDAIVQVAAQTFAEHGYAATTMSAIAGKLGGSKGTLWSYFPSKEALFVAVMDRLTEDFQAQLSLILKPGRDPAVVLRRFCEEFLGKVASPSGAALYRLVIAEARRFPEVGRIFYDRGPRATQRQLAEFMNDAMARGALRKADPLVAAQQLMGLCLSGSRQVLLFGLIDALSPEAFALEIDQAMAMFMGAYAVNGEQGSGECATVPEPFRERSECPAGGRPKPDVATP